MAPLCLPRPQRAHGTLASLALGVLAACGGGGDARPPSVLLVTLDTTRADALGCYGGERAATPSLDALAAESLLFERAHTVAPITLPAHASLLTGLYPLRHSVRDNGLWPLPEEAHTLAELARERGYQTAAVVAAAVLDRTFGLDQGFESYRVADVEQETPVYESLPASEVVDRALAWLEGRDRERPFFLWVHFFDPHAPYRPPPPFDAGREGLELYFGEVEAMDRALGRLFAALRAEGELRRTVVAVAADHGEALGEHGEYTHGPYCYETTLRVPLLLRDPSGFRAGEREERPVSLVDLFPTLAEAMGVEPAALGGIDGVSLWRRAPPAGRGLYFESFMGYLAFGWSPLAGWLEGRRKYLHSAEPQAFDLASDPGEEHDLLRVGAFDPGPARRAIEALAARPVLHALPLERLDEALGEELRALGYASAGAAAAAVPHPLAPSRRPSPASMLGQYTLLLNAIALLENGRTEEALPLFERMLATTPESVIALEQLSSALVRLGRAREALPYLERLRDVAPPRALNFQNLASAYSSLGRLDEAIVALRRCLALDPENRAALEGLVRILSRMGREEEAEPYRARLRAR